MFSEDYYGYGQNTPRRSHRPTLQRTELSQQKRMISKQKQKHKQRQKQKQKQDQNQKRSSDDVRLQKLRNKYNESSNKNRNIQKYSNSKANKHRSRSISRSNSNSRNKILNHFNTNLFKMIHYDDRGSSNQRNQQIKKRVQKRALQVLQRNISPSSNSNELKVNHNIYSQHSNSGNRINNKKQNGSVKNPMKSIQIISNNILPNEYNYNIQNIQLQNDEYQENPDEQNASQNYQQSRSQLSQNGIMKISTVKKKQLELLNGSQHNSNPLQPNIRYVTMSTTKQQTNTKHYKLNNNGNNIQDQLNQSVISVNSRHQYTQLVQISLSKINKPVNINNSNKRNDANLYSESNTKSNHTVVKSVGKNSRNNSNSVTKIQNPFGKTKNNDPHPYLYPNQHIINPLVNNNQVLAHTITLGHEHNNYLHVGNPSMKTDSHSQIGQDRGSNSNSESISNVSSQMVRKDNILGKSDYDRIKQLQQMVKEEEDSGISGNRYQFNNILESQDSINFNKFNYAGSIYSNNNQNLDPKSANVSQSKSGVSSNSHRNNSMFNSKKNESSNSNITPNKNSMQNMNSNGDNSRNRQGRQTRMQNSQSNQLSKLIKNSSDLLKNNNQHSDSSNRNSANIDYSVAQKYLQPQPQLSRELDLEASSLSSNYDHMINSNKGNKRNSNNSNNNNLSNNNHSNNSSNNNNNVNIINNINNNNYDNGDMMENKAENIMGTSSKIKNSSNIKIESYLKQQSNIKVNPNHNPIRNTISNLNINSNLRPNPSRISVINNNCVPTNYASSNLQPQPSAHHNYFANSHQNHQTTNPTAINTRNNINTSDHINNPYEIPMHTITNLEADTHLLNKITQFKQRKTDKQNTRMTAINRQSLSDSLSESLLSSKQISHLNRSSYDNFEEVLSVNQHENNSQNRSRTVLSPFSNKRYNNPDSHSANNSTNNINTKDNYREINVKKVKGKMEGNEGMSTNYLNPVPVYNCNDNAYPTTQNQVIINSNLNVEHSHLHPYNSINTNKTSSLSISNSHGPSSRRMTELELSLSEDQNNHCVSNNNSNKNNDKSGIGTQYITNNGLFTSFNSSSFNNTALIHNSSNNNININNNSSDKGMQMSVGSSEYHVNSSVDIHYLNRGNPTDDGNNPSQKQTQNQFITYFNNNILNPNLINPYPNSSSSYIPAGYNTTSPTLKQQSNQFRLWQSLKQWNNLQQKKIIHLYSGFGHQILRLQTLMDKIYQHIAAINKIADFVQQTQQFYVDHLQREMFHICMFLLLKRFYSQRLRIIDSLRRGVSCFYLVGKQIDTQEIQQFHNSKPINQLCEYITQCNKPVQKILQKFYRYLSKKYPKNTLISLYQTQSSNAPVDRQNKLQLSAITQKLNEQLQLLISKIDQNQNQHSNSYVRDSEYEVISVRAFTIMELVFLMSDLEGRKVKKLKQQIEPEEFQMYCKENYGLFKQTVLYYH